ncbi:G-protein coupled receptor-like protein K2 [Trichoplax sp. H2]|nr:G-protein coupled receptor-like protein K2 [Trichoplax sp. H2]RDD36626.1 G-protein coupled receptor-like protein K2 [Trichoplax sp. H2]|eukprot:RDD36570.1 G-protein coupled receptor-like protein K2 [Trichoplax sp. H2]
MNNDTDIIDMNIPMQSISILGMVGNLALLSIIIFSKRLKDPSYIFVLNISVSDLITAIQVFIIFSFSNRKSPQLLNTNNIICKVFYTIFATSYFASTLSLTLISLYRLKIVSDPHRFKHTSTIYKHSGKFAITVWIVGLLLVFPISFVLHFSPINDNCDTYYPYGNFFNSVFFTSILVIGTIIPGTIMIVNYTRIAFMIRARTFPLINNTELSKASWKRSKSIFKVLAASTALYMLLSWPFFTSLMILSFANETQANLVERNPDLAYVVTSTFTASNIVYVINPFLFLIFDRNVRSSIHKVWVQCLRKFTNHG